jgi:hypothetical protein
MLAGIALIIISPALFSFKLLSCQDMAKIGELYIPILGIILFPYIGSIEEEHNIHEIAYVKQTPHIYVFTARMILMLILTAVLVGAAVIYAVLNGGSFPALYTASGILISSVFFGMFGLTVSGITGSLVPGYLASFAYFIFECMTRGKYTGRFFALSLLNNSFMEKYNLLMLIILMAAVNLYIVYRKS